jgi:hypothetical protein
MTMTTSVNVHEAGGNSAVDQKRVRAAVTSRGNVIVVTAAMTGNATT